MSEPVSNPSTLDIPAPEHEPKLLAPPQPAPAPPTSDTKSPAPHKRRWPYVIVAVVALAALFFWLHGRGASSSATKAGGKGGKAGAPAATPVVATTATTGNIGVYVTGLGAITPVYTDIIKARVSGQLMSVHFKEGDLVKQGDPLIEIDSRPYDAVVMQAEGALLRDQALLANARVDLDRYALLMKTNAIPEQMYATQKALVEQDEGIVKNDQGTLDAAKVNVVYCHITSPIAGVVGLRLVDPGNIVNTTDANGMIVIAQMQPISVIFPISEDQLPPVLKKVHAGQKLTVDAWDRELKNKIATGTLSNLDNEIDQTTGTVKLRAIFNNDNLTLFPNQFVNARLLVQEKTGVTLMPSAAIQRNTNDTYVYLIKPDNTVTIRTIKVGTTEGDQTEVTSGLNPGDKVVMTGVDKLQEGSKVNPSQDTSKSGGAQSGGSQ